MAAPEKQDEFKLILTSNFDDNWWRYEFCIGERHSYDSPTQVIGYGDDLIAYENEYFFQMFSHDANAGSIMACIDFIREREASEAMAFTHLECFSHLMDLAPLNKQERFQMDIVVNPGTQIWMYRFSIDEVTLCSSGPMDIQDEYQGLVHFQRFMLWGGLRMLRSFGR